MTRRRKPTSSLVRSSAAEHLTFVAASGAGGVEATYADENDRVVAETKRLGAKPAPAKPKGAKKPVTLVRDQAPAFNGPAPNAQNAPRSAPQPSTAPTPRTTALGAPTANVGARSALARDSARLVNSPTPRGTVDRRVTVPETEGRLLTASRLLSPHGTEMRARTPSRARSTRSSSRARRSLCGRSPDTRDARRRANPRGIRGEKATAPEIALRGRC